MLEFTVVVVSVGVGVGEREREKDRAESEDMFFNLISFLNNLFFNFFYLVKINKYFFLIYKLTWHFQ